MFRFLFLLIECFKMLVKTPVTYRRTCFKQKGDPESYVGPVAFNVVSPMKGCVFLSVFISVPRFYIMGKMFVVNFCLLSVRLTESLIFAIIFSCLE